MANAQVSYAAPWVGLSGTSALAQIVEQTTSESAESDLGSIDWVEACWIALEHAAEAEASTEVAVWPGAWVLQPAFHAVEGRNAGPDAFLELLPGDSEPS